MTEVDAHRARIDAAQRRQIVLRRLASRRRNPDAVEHAVVADVRHRAAVRRVDARAEDVLSIVADRDVGAIASGLIGQSVKDEAYKGKRSDESRTATGLTPPRFTDSVLAWCALWGISSFPVIHRLMGASVTAGAVPIGKFTPTQLVLPVLVGPRTLGRWQAVVASEQVIRAMGNTESTAVARTARAWLVAHGARAILTFRVNVSDNPNAPERSLGAGRLESLN